MRLGDVNVKYVSIGGRTDQEPWFSGWNQPGSRQPAPKSPSTESLSISAPKAAFKKEFKPLERKQQIADGETGHSMDSLFGPYLQGATTVSVDEPFIGQRHQIENFLRFCGLLVRLGTVRAVKLVTKELTDESINRLETVKRSLADYAIDLVYESSTTLHDRQIATDTGWEISLGRGLDIYKKPNDWFSVSATDFALRPCYQTTIIFHRLGSGRSDQGTRLTQLGEPG